MHARLDLALARNGRGEFDWGIPRAGMYVPQFQYGSESVAKAFRIVILIFKKVQTLCNTVRRGLILSGNIKALTMSSLTLHDLVNSPREWRML